MLVCGKTFRFTMEDQIPSSTPPQQEQTIPGGLTPEVLEALKARAREEAIRMTMLQRQAQQQEVADRPTAQAMVPPSQPIQFPQAEPQYVYVRRNLTVAELGLVLLLACGLVTGIQAGWNFVSNRLPTIEIKAR
jgi:hypothetical protein